MRSSHLQNPSTFSQSFSYNDFFPIPKKICTYERLAYLSVVDLVVYFNTEVLYAVFLLVGHSRQWSIIKTTLNCQCQHLFIVTYVGSRKVYTLFFSLREQLAVGNICVFMFIFIWGIKAWKSNQGICPTENHNLFPSFSPAEKKMLMWAVQVLRTLKEYSNCI